MGSLGKLKGIRKCKNCGVDVKIYHSEHISYHSKKRKKNK